MFLKKGGMMQKIFYSVFFIFLLCLIGCGHQLQHPTKPRSQWAADNTECEKIVRKAIREAPGEYGVYDEIRLIKRCMKEKGWHR
jgi:hypothetical protein